MNNATRRPTTVESALAILNGFGVVFHGSTPDNPATYAVTVNGRAVNATAADLFNWVSNTAASGFGVSYDITGAPINPAIDSAPVPIERNRRPAMICYGARRGLSVVRFYAVHDPAACQIGRDLLGGVVDSVWPIGSCWDCDGNARNNPVPVWVYGIEDARYAGRLIDPVTLGLLYADEPATTPPDAYLVNR